MRHGGEKEEKNKGIVKVLCGKKEAPPYLTHAHTSSFIFVTQNLEALMPHEIRIYSIHILNGNLSKKNILGR